MQSHYSLISVALLISTSLFAQEKPKTHNFFDKENITLFSADALVRSLDAQSTRRMLSNPCHCFEEKQLPKAIANSTPTMYAYSLGFSAGMMGLSYLAHKTHHHKIERLIPMIDIVLDGSAVGHNYALRPTLNRTYPEMQNLQVIEAK
jgi:hypothetical protein